jgi:hypothetical protein
MKFFSTAPPLSGSGNEEHAGEPELMATMLPSDYPTGTLSQQMYNPLIEAERELRRASCLKALQTLRSFAIQRAHIKQAHHKHVRGIKATTRAATMIQRLGDRLRHAQWIYSDSRDRLVRLGMTQQDRRTYKVLSEKDFQDLLRSVKGQRSLGEGQVKLPWFWRIEPALNEQDDESVLSSETGVSSEYEDSEWLIPTVITCSTFILGLRVEWFKSRERYKRWEEETLWLQRETASVILTFHARSLFWQSKVHEDSSPDWQAYCRRQQGIWTNIRKNAFANGAHILKVV